MHVGLWAVLCYRTSNTIAPVSKHHPLKNSLVVSRMHFFMDDNFSDIPTIHDVLSPHLDPNLASPCAQAAAAMYDKIVDTDAEGEWSRETHAAMMWIRLCQTGEIRKTNGLRKDRLAGGCPKHRMSVGIKVAWSLFDMRETVTNDSPYPYPELSAS